MKKILFVITLLVGVVSHLFAQAQKADSLSKKPIIGFRKDLEKPNYVVFPLYGGKTNPDLKGFEYEYRFITISRFKILNGNHRINLRKGLTLQSRIDQIYGFDILAGLTIQPGLPLTPTITAEKLFNWRNYQSFLVRGETRFVSKFSNPALYFTAGYFSGKKFPLWKKFKFGGQLRAGWSIQEGAGFNIGLVLYKDKT